MKPYSKFYTNYSQSFPIPSDIDVSLCNIHSQNSGRDTEDGEAHIKKIAIKRKLAMVWNGPTDTQVKSILQAFKVGDKSISYIYVTYIDPYTASVQTRKFYTGDATAKVGMATDNGINFYRTLSFDIIEK